jgi:hypothetical protein
MLTVTTRVKESFFWFGKWKEKTIDINIAYYSTCFLLYVSPIDGQIEAWH